jgi:hypothetical protein
MKEVIDDSGVSRLVQRQLNGQPLVRDEKNLMWAIAKPLCLDPSSTAMAFNYHGAFVTEKHAKGRRVITVSDTKLSQGTS